jgi:nucleotide-binding universal stress UspA family protein
VTVVVGYIPTDEGLVAVDQAVAFAKRDHSRLVVVNTGHHGNNAHPLFASAADLDALAVRLDGEGLEHEIRQPPSGSAAQEILGAASELGAELIVIGIRRRSPVGKLVTGSTAQQVLLNAECAVLAVKPRMRQAARSGG